ncbi:hypothetical protein F5Y09DRAFT_95381 [Xylaria sp. FL1042]|nr:hypothetical protein F5Y09DRAFT_95381 [Xylaria sp. FL1042]
MPHPKPQRRSPSAGTSLLSEPHTQLQQHIRFSSSSRPTVSLLSHARTQSTHTHDTHGPRSSSQPRETGSLARPSRPQRENTERISQVSTTESQRYPRSSELAPRIQQRPFPPLRTRDILSCPRLQQVTGLLPRKVDLWADRELPPDELYRLAWAMALPEQFPMKRPRGEILTPIAPKVKKT